MNLRIVGAGLPRTGTSSAKRAIETLTGERCYHMREVFNHGEDHLTLWLRALRGDLSVFEEIFDGYVAAVDWPTSAFWRELADMLPEAKVLLTHRGDAETWWRSADRTVWEAMRQHVTEGPFGEMNVGLSGRFHSDLDDGPGARAAYDRHVAEVRATIDPDRLVTMSPGDGWEPLCQALDLPIPDEPFPHLNTAKDFRTHNGWD